MFARFLKGTSCLSSVVFCCAVLSAAPGNAISLKNAVSVTLDSNPAIGEAIENREAIEFELRQAKGLVLPSVDLEASAGKRRLDNPGRRALGIENDPLYPTEVGVVALQTLYDGGRIRAEIDSQASRVDSASFRVLERSETIGLQVVREYLEYLLQAEILSISADNVRVHQGIAGNISSGIAGGTLTEADSQQARERVLSAKARLQEAEEDLSSAGIRFFTLTGIPLKNASMPASVSSKLPKSLDEAIGLGRKNNPRVHLSMADIDSADANVAAARADFLPELFLEGRARTGDDIDGTNGGTEDLQARVILRWNLYRGGIKAANEQEQVRRASEQRMIHHQIHRQVEEAVRISWDRRIRQSRLAQTLNSQAAENSRLVSSYRQQFSVGQRSLLDTLDAQNTKYNVDVLAKTARYAALFAEYRLLAATGQLLATFNLEAPEQSNAYARSEFNVPPTVAAETDKRVPSHVANDLPLDLLAPIRKN